MTAQAKEISKNEDATNSPSRERNLWRVTLVRFSRQKSAMVGLAAIIIIGLTAIFAPVIAPSEPDKVFIGAPGHEGVRKRAKPCIHMFGCSPDLPQHIMGLDGNVRDQFSRIVYASRISLRVGFVVVAVSLTTGTLLGSIAGYAGGFIDNSIMRVMDVLMAFPSLLLAITISFVLRDRLDPLLAAMLAISIVSIPSYARVVRSVVLSAKEMEYVEAAHSQGAGHVRVIWRHILPNAIPPLIVQATLGFGTAIIDAAALSFLGLGAQPPTPEWGTMLGRERNNLFNAPHLVFFPGFAIMFTVLAFNLLGDGLRDALDPRLSQAK